MDRDQIFFTSFRTLLSKELRGIGTRRSRRPVGAIPPTVLENRVNRSITIDPTVGSRLNFFHDFPMVVFDGVDWNRYDTLTTSGRAIPLTTLENRVIRSITIDPTVGSRSNFFHEFSEAVFDGVARNRYDTTMSSGRGHSTDRTTVPGQKVHIYRSDRWIPLKFFSRVSAGCFGLSSMEWVHHADAVRSGPFHRQD